MSVLDMEEIKKIPGYKVILKAVLKTQIQYMVEQLATHTDEESVILTASVSDGTLSHLGSDSGKGFLEDNEEVKSQFLGFCLKRHEQNQQVIEDGEKQQKHEQQMLETDQLMPVLTQMGFAPGFRRNRMSPGGSMRSSSQRFEPYTTQRQQRNSTSSDPGLFSLPTSESKDIEPSEHSNDGSDTNLTETPQVSGLDSKDDEKSNSSSASTIPNEQSEGTPAGEQGDSEVDPNVSVKVEAITETEMEHDANTGATEMEDDLQQNYRHEQNQQVTEDEEKQQEHQGQMLETNQLMPVLTQMGFDSELESNTIKSPQRNFTSSNPSQLSLATVEVKVEPSEHSNDGSDTNLTKSSQVSGLDSKDDEKSNSSSTSTIPNEQSEGTPAGEQGDSEVDPNVSVTNTMETVSESEMELDPNSGATGIESDLQQNYTFKFNTKRKLICHTNETKLAALLEVERGQKSKTQIARQFKVPLPTLSGWVKNKQNIKESLKNFVSPHRKTSRKPNFQELDEKLYAWYCSIHGRHIQITNKVLRDKACCFAKDIGMKNYAIGLRSWTERFKARHGISFKHFKLNDSNSTAGHKSNNLTGLDSRNARESTARSTPIEVNRDNHSNSITGFKNFGSGILAEVRNENTNNVTTVNAGIVSDSMPMNMKKEMLSAGFSSENIGEYLPMEYENIGPARTVKVEPFMIKEEY